MSRPLNPEYLGDGLYATAEEDGCITLTAGHHDQLLADKVAAMFLEPEVFAALIKYAERAKETR